MWFSPKLWYGTRPQWLACHIQPILLFQNVFVSERRKSCQNCLWDAPILIITGRFLLQTGQIFNPAEGRQAFPERDVAPWQRVARKPETYTGRRTELFSRTCKENLLKYLSSSRVFCYQLYLLVVYKNNVLLARLISRQNTEVKLRQVLQSESSLAGY